MAAAELIYVGMKVRIPFTFQDPDTKAYVNPTSVTVRVLKPDLSYTDYVYGTDSEVTRPSTGHYLLTIPVDQPEDWIAGIKGTGTYVGYLPVSFHVLSSVFGP